MGQPESARGRPSLAVPRLPTARAAEESTSVREPPAASAASVPPPKWPQPCSGRASSLPTPQPAGVDRCDGESDVPFPNGVSVSLLSNAVMLEHQNFKKSSQLATSALGKVSAALGVRQSELTLYEVREVKEGMQLSTGISRLAVAVKNSGENRA